jgi:hypothetical protein
MWRRILERLLAAADSLDELAERGTVVPEVDDLRSVNATSNRIGSPTSWAILSSRFSESFMSGATSTAGTGALRV